MSTQAKPIPAITTDRLLRRPEVEAITGMSTSRLYAAMREGRFPPPRRIGAGPNGAVAWLHSEVQAWMSKLPVANPEHPNTQ